MKIFSSNPTGFRQLGTSQIVLGVLSILWQIGVYVCALYPNDFGKLVYSKEYAKDIALSSSGLIAGIVFILNGVAARRTANVLEQPALENAASSLRIFKLITVFSVLISIIMVIFSGYLAYLTSHWYLQTNLLQVGNIAHGALPLHILHCICGLIAGAISVYGFLMDPITKPLPPVGYKKGGGGGLENPIYGNEKMKI